MSSSIEDALGNLDELCGIYEWRAKGTRPNQPNYVVYVGSTCVRRKPQKLGGRIIRYCKYGNHKEDLINEALATGYELWVRVNLLRVRGRPRAWRTHYCVIMITLGIKDRMVEMMA